MGDGLCVSWRQPVVAGIHIFDMLQMACLGLGSQGGKVSAGEVKTGEVELFVAILYGGGQYLGERAWRRHFDLRFADKVLREKCVVGGLRRRQRDCQAKCVRQVHRLREAGRQRPRGMPASTNPRQSSKSSDAGSAPGSDTGSDTGSGAGSDTGSDFGIGKGIEGSCCH